MDTEVRRFRRDSVRHLGTRSGTAVRYTPALRRRAVGYARRRRDAGVAVAAIARELGLRPRTLGVWLREPTRTPRLRRVTLDPESAVTGPGGRGVLVTPQGVRVEGLEVPDLVTLLRGLR